MLNRLEQQLYPAQFSQIDSSDIFHIEQHSSYNNDESLLKLQILERWPSVLSGLHTCQTPSWPVEREGGELIRLNIWPEWPTKGERGFGGGKQVNRFVESTAALLHL